MADADIIRATRIRNILNNSESRLNGIMQQREIEINELHDVADEEVFEVDANETDEEAPNANNAHSSDDTPPTSFDEAENVEEIVVNKVVPVSVTNKRKLVASLIGLGVLLRCVLCFTDLSFMCGGTIVLPYSVFLLLKMNWFGFGEIQNRKGVWTMLVNVIGVDKEIIEAGQSVYNYTTTIIVPFTVYFAAFVVTHFLCVGYGMDKTE